MSKHLLKLFGSPKRKPRRHARPAFQPQLEAMESRLVPSFYEAETAQLGGISPYFDGVAVNDYPRVEDVSTSGQTNYDGTGYVNLAYSDDSTITWDDVNGGPAGDYTLSFRYSMDTYYTDVFTPYRPMGLSVNGNVITDALAFHATGDSATGDDPWSIWMDLPVTVHLTAGANSVELFSTNIAAAGANPHVDSLTVTPVAGGAAPDTPTGLSASGGVGDVDLSWSSSAIASSYNIYRGTSSGSETLLATGVTATYFFDTGLLADGTSYYYQVSAVNSAGESARAGESSATPSAPAGLLFSDDFSSGASSAWSFSPAAGYWVPQVGQLTDSGGDTVAGVAQTAMLALPGGTASWQADLRTREGTAPHAAAVDLQGNPGVSGISVRSGDGLNEVLLFVEDDNPSSWPAGNYPVSLFMGVTVNGVWQASTQVGTATPFTWHTYQIRLDADGTFAVLLDGHVLSSGISAGPASAWAGGLGWGTLFTQSDLDNRHLSTAFDNVRALAQAPSPQPAPPWLPPNLGGANGNAQGSFAWGPRAGTPSDNGSRAVNRIGEALIATGLIPTAFGSNHGSDGVGGFWEADAARVAGESGLGADEKLFLVGTLAEAWPRA
jgi:hypothetical protein